nr:RNA-directed DNA polymerase, eukaryota [Tanacetum cinerariifolium]
MHLQANVVRFERPLKHPSRPSVITKHAPAKVHSFASTLTGNPKNTKYISPAPAMVLGDECVVNRDLDKCVMGEVTDFASINNMYVLLSNEGFQRVKLMYLGSLWGLIELGSNKAKSRFMKYVANVVRFERPLQHPSRPSVITKPAPAKVHSFASTLTGNPKNTKYISPAPAMVLGDECIVNRDLDKCVMGEVTDFASINNMYVLLSNKGFQCVKLMYLGSLWGLIELGSNKAKSRERIVWVDIEGVSIHAWSRPTFSKIGSRWGEVLDLEESKDDCFARKRICIKTTQEDNILERFKIIIRRKIFVVRAKELFIWSPTFIDIKEVDY